MAPKNCRNPAEDFDISFQSLHMPPHNTFFIYLFYIVAPPRKNSWVPTDYNGGQSQLLTGVKFNSHGQLVSRGRGWWFWNLDHRWAPPHEDFQKMRCELKSDHYHPSAKNAGCGSYPSFQLPTTKVNANYKTETWRES